jgi:type IV pilus assembly protein PilZ
MLATETLTREDFTHPSTQAEPLVRVEYSNVEDFLVDYTSNETIGGMFIQTARLMAVGTEFKLRIQLPGGRRTIETLAEVRWTLPIDVAAPMNPGMGIRFEGLTTVDKRLVENLLVTWR